jgi:CubicO group peptidase (beta-lactamase class C family)
MNTGRRKEKVAALFAENFQHYEELGASFSVWQDGEELLSLANGFRDRERTEVWSAETPVLVWSATKGPAAACLLHACQERQVSLTSRIAEFWPEFGVNGKDAITIGQVLSHQAALPALSIEISVFDYHAVVEALGAERPQWPLGQGHGYHPRTYGFLLDELVRRITGGTTLGDYWRFYFAGPLELDFWIGVDDARAAHVAPVFPPRGPAPKDDPFYASLLIPKSLTARAFASPHGLRRVSAMNDPRARTASFPAFGGIGTARSLAKFYAMLANHGVLEGRRFFERSIIDAMTTTLTDGRDRVLQMDTAFSAGYMRDPLDVTGRKTRSLFGPSLRAFGHPGAGGSHAFADPEHQLAVAYVMNQMEPGVLPNAKALRLIEALYG